MRRFCVATLAAVTLVALAGMPVRADIIQPGTTPFQAHYKDVTHPEQGLAAFTVIATGFTPGQQIFVEECDGNAPSVPNWDPTINCDSGSSPAPIIADGSGVAYFDATSANHKFVPFKGESPQANFNCIGLADPPLAGSDSLPDFKNCQVRVSSNNADSTSDQQMFGLVVPNNPGSALVAQYKQANHPSQGLAPITISASGFVPGQQVFVEQCDGIPTTASGWDPTINCDNGTSPAPLPADGSGNVTFDANSANHKFVPFRATSPQGDFNCLAPADPSSSNGLIDYTNCKIRVSSNNAASTSDQQFFNLTVPAGVPDAPTIATATEMSGGAMVAFTPGPDQGYPVSSFTASCSSSNGGAAGSASGAGSPISVTGLTNGRTYTCTVTATNGAGTSQPSAASNAVVHALAPDAPVSVTANAANGAAQVVFTVPDFDGPSFDNGSAVTSLTATCTGTGPTGFQSGSSSPILVGGLTNGDSYTCTVTATNGIGTSPDSAASNSVTPDAVPDAPIIGTATRGPGSASVTYTAGADNGSTITSFTAACTSSGTGAFGSHGGTLANPIIVNGLTNGQPYTCTVSATNGVGTGPVSGASNSLTPATTPDTPTALAAARGNHSVGISFTAGFNGGATAQYDASCSSPDAGSTPGSSINQAGSPITVGGLTNGDSYTCTVTAHNAVGSSGPSAPSNAVTPGAVPDAPTAVTASRSGSGSLSVAFTPGNDNGYTVSSFTATCSSSDSGAVTPVSNSGGSSPIAINGLTNGKTYACSVHATNAIGTGSESASSNAIIPATVPSAPTIGTVTRSGGGLRVPFTAGTNNGLPITSFTATCTASGGATRAASGPSSPVTVTGVTLGADYTCTVRATNGVGTGPASGESNDVIPSLTPSAPVAVSVTSGSTTTSTGPLRVVFAVGAGNGTPITNNTATCTSSNGGVTRTGSSATSPITVAAATTAKTYTCTVKSTNDAGTGAASAASNAIVVGSPAAPTIMTLVSESTTTATGPLQLSFVPGADNGSPVTSPSFTASCTSSDGGVTKTAIGSSSPMTVAGLTTGKTYVCQLRPHNARGYGLFSPPSGAVIVGSPAKPGGPLATRTAAGNLRVSFTDLTTAQNGGSPLTTPKYTATCVSTNGGVTGSATGNGNPITVTGLTAGKSYRCSVKAHNARGYSTPSAASSSVTA